MKCEDVDIHEHTEQESRFEPTSILKSSLLWPVRSHVLSASLQKLWRKRRTILPARHNHNDHSCDNPIGTQGPSESKVRMYFIASAVSALQLFQSLTVGMARLVRCGVAALAAISLQGVIHVEL